MPSLQAVSSLLSLIDGEHLWLLMLSFDLFSIRYCLVPSFGRSTIQKFSSNASEMKKLAARNYEDLLQVDLSCLVIANVLTSASVCHSGF